MNPRAEALIDLLDLKPHPEGGFYRRFHQSQTWVLREADGSGRRALTSIYYLLPEGSISRWHRVFADEAWHHYEGAAVELLSFAPDGSNAFSQPLGPLLDGCAPAYVVPAGWWQAARPLGAYALVGCTVGPGFEFEDFTLLADVPAAARPAPSGLADFALFL
jgi:predicted cupin superfamily sugar epimerase